MGGVITTRIGVVRVAAARAGDACMQEGQVREQPIVRPVVRITEGKPHSALGWLQNGLQGRPGRTVVAALVANQPTRQPGMQAVGQAVQQAARPPGRSHNQAGGQAPA